MNSREDLIASLSSDLQRVRPTGNINLLAVGWLLLSAFYVVGITHWFGPVRSNALVQLVTEPRFMLESVVGVLAITVTTLIAFRAAIPGVLSARFFTTGVVLMLVWLSCYVVGLLSPALEPSMLGKREHCIWETFIYALPPMLLAFVLTRRLYPLQPVQTAMYFSLAAGMMPALYMQIACMYAPAHILQFHILPGLMVVLVGAAIAWAVRSRP